jgi:hypothetical protein
VSEQPDNPVTDRHDPVPGDTPPGPPPLPPPPAPASIGPVTIPSDRPEVAVGAAFAGGLVVALILKRLAQ